MTSVLWAAFGIAIVAALLHGTLGLRRPPDRTYLSFACIMASLAAFLVLEADLYRATTTDESVEAVRRRVVMAFLANASFFVFLPAYTRVRFPRGLMPAYWIALVLLFAVNLLAPYGIWFSAKPVLLQAVFRGEIYTTVVAPPMAIWQYAYAIFFTSQLVLGFACAVAMFRRRERQRGVTFAVSVIVVGVHMILDVFRDAVGGAWPYVTEYGFVTWGLIMSVQLALDYRAQSDMLARAIVRVELQAARLESIVEALRALEENMDVPLHTLQTGIAELTGETPNGQAQVACLHRAVIRLREFSQSMPDLRTWTKPSSRFN